jgi:hypothetical protein
MYFDLTLGFSLRYVMVSVSFFCVTLVDRHTSVSGDVLSTDSYETRELPHCAAGWYSGNFIAPA